MMARNPRCLYDLPNEILVSILSGFSTQDLLPLVVVSRRFHSLILRILHFRLLLAAALPDYKLILEAYHPSKRYSDPYLFCTYLGTDGLSSKHEGKGSLYEDCDGEEGRLAKLGGLYSRFRPERPGVSGSMPARRVAGAVLNTASSSTSGTMPIYADGGDGGFTKVMHTLNLDADELFGQFCAYASLVRLGPRRGVFLSNVHIVRSGQGVMRVWKQWLQDRAQDLWQQEQELDGFKMNPTPTTSCPSIGADKNIMWTDYRKNVGLRVAVRDRNEILYGNRHAIDLDDMPMTFTIEIQELVVRTTHLMLAVETSTQQQGNISGKALIFGNFATAAPSHS
ncbi:F-box domain protein [Fonsecaea pedrosoi]|nr:F-box domain protein [Fonsecaea pedrosoi]